ncbi:MAG: SlyX family protein [Pseudomonadota bacterium]
MTSQISLEERLAHAERQGDELSTIVADQANRIARLERQLAALVELARNEAAQAGSLRIGDRPPHY